MAMTLNELAKQINDNARAHGFWDNDRNFGEMIALAHSELSEALEEHRSGNPGEYFSGGVEYVDRDGTTDAMFPSSQPVDDKGRARKPEGVAVELADCIIRCLDTMHSLGVDIDGVVARKMAYNASRPFRHGRAY